MNTLAALCFKENRILSTACRPLIFLMDEAVDGVSKPLSLPNNKPGFVLRYLPLVPWSCAEFGPHISCTSCN